MKTKAAVISILLVLLVGAISLGQDSESINKKLEKGGKHWSAPNKVSVGNDHIVTGKKLWILPEEDRVFEIKKSKLSIPFNWQVQSAQKVPSGVFVSIFFQARNADGEIQWNNLSKRIEVNKDAEKMTYQAQFDMEKYSGEFEVIFYLHAGNYFEPESNLLRLKVKQVK